MMETKELLYKAAQIKAQINQLEAEYEDLKPDLKKAVDELTADAEKPEVNVGELGKFCKVKGKTKWTYSPATEQKAQDLKQIQKDEQANGVATGEQGFDIKFFDANAPKKEKE